MRRLLTRGGRDTSARDSTQERQSIVTLSEVNYFGLAGLLLDQHGSDAKAKVARLRAEAQQEGDTDAAADWLAVQQAIGLLTDDSVHAKH